MTGERPASIKKNRLRHCGPATHRLTRVLATMAVALIALNNGNDLRAQNQPAAPPPAAGAAASTSGFPEDNPMNMAEDEELVDYSLTDCLVMARQDNFTLKRADVAARVAAAERSLADAQFDWILGFNTQYKRTKDQSETSNAIQAAQLGIPPTTFNRNDHGMLWTNALSITRYFPTGTTASFSWSYNKSEFDSNDILGVNDRITISLSVSQSILRNFGFGPNQFSLELAAIAEQQARSRATQQYIETIFVVEQTFWNLAFTHEDLTVTANSTRLARQDYDIQIRRKNAGLGTEIDVVAAEARLKAKERELYERQRRLRDASDQLLALIAPQKFIELGQGAARIIIRPTGYNPQEIPTETVPDVRTLIRTALQRREELRQAQLSRDSARLSVEYRQNQTLPDLTARAGFNFGGEGPTTGRAFRSFGLTDQTEWFLGLELRVPLGNIEANANLDKARLQQTDAEFVHRQTEVQVISEVLGAMRQYQTALRTLDSSRVGVRLAERQVEAADERLRRGMATRFEVDSFRNALDEAKREALSSWVAVKIARAQLEKVTGPARSE